jgi:hypothetical protein
MQTTTVALLVEALEYAPTSGPTARDLVGVTMGDVFLCAPCVGRIVARGCGHLLRAGVQVWRPAIGGPCATGHTHIRGTLRT